MSQSKRSGVWYFYTIDVVTDSYYDADEEYQISDAVFILPGNSIAAHIGEILEARRETHEERGFTYGTSAWVSELCRLLPNGKKHPLDLERVFPPKFFPPVF